ncbi:alkaline phosphatase [Oscillatoria sp. HE19RPO]|uniref:alkaline phosphatase D family protein n=1 Tax=Oscillatoria sp. HE19RPO TaxID=2954806 RepID=UPI0020C499E7|nr:alkaline phosphatase D family protein [Oscillatoria sp. HE19RPO]
MLNAQDLYNETYYLARNPDVANAVAAGLFTTGFAHFETFGQNEGRNPTALFDTRYYLTLNPDVAAAVSANQLTPFQHYIAFGQAEGRNPSTLYNEQRYLSDNPDVQAAVNASSLTGIQHFQAFGQNEGRIPSSLYNPAYYLSKNTDVAAAVERDEITGIGHYLTFGIAEGREFTPFIQNNTTLPNGVAAGDVTQNSAVLWTRSTEVGPVIFEYSTDASFGAIAGQTTNFVTDPTVPVQVQVSDLAPQTQYYYRVTDAAGTSAVGQFRTPAPLGTQAGLRFGVTGDWQGELAPYPSISNVRDRNLDFFVLMGDTVETDSISPDLPGVRQSANLDQFRTKHNEIYSERFGLNTGADLRASTATYNTWDDHEITNDFAGGAAPAESPQRNGIFGTEGQFVNETPVFNQALEAFQDYKPMTEQQYGETGDPRTANKEKLYRYNVHGSDAASFVLDVRSFRDKPLPFIPETASPEAVNAYLQNSFDPNRTMLGQAQLQEFKNDLLAAENAGITWKFVMSTVPMQHFGIAVSGERWEGFEAERTELLRFIDENNISNVVFVTGDFHGNVVNNVTYQDGLGQPQKPTGAFDVMIGPAAIQLNIGQGPFAAPFGPATVTFTPDALLSPAEKDRYRGMTDEAEKNAFVRQVIDNRIVPLGYDPVGLEGSEIDAQLLQGSYFNGHNYGWTEFAIAPDTQQLTVTTFGVDPYTQGDMEANPAEVANRTPTIRLQFTVNPQTGDVLLPSDITTAVEENLARDFGLQPGNFSVVSAQQQTWSDGCLGLGEANESCLLALVEGWQVTVQSGDRTLVYRTDDSGSQVRLDRQSSQL